MAVRNGEGDERDEGRKRRRGGEERDEERKCLLMKGKRRVETRR